MKAFRIPIRFLSAFVFLFFAIASLSSCGGSGIGDLAGGGTGGTGISTGAVTGFGSIVMNGAHYRTDGEVAPGFITKKIARGVVKSRQEDRDVFSVGMVVTLHHSPGNNNATEIDYEPNLVGPVGLKAPAGEDPPTIMVLGLPVVVDNATLFANLNPGDVVEVSGFVDNVGRIRATFVAPSPIPGENEISGFISGLDTADNTFHLGPLPDGSGYTVTVSYTAAAIQPPPGGLDNGMYARVKTTQPVNGKITATRVKISVARTNFPENTTVDLDGLVTKLRSSSGDLLSFDLEGKSVRTDDATVFIGGTAEDIQPNVRVQVHGKEIGGALSAGEITFR